MEHEDNAQFDNYLQSAQQQNLQLGNNTGNGDALVGLGLGLNVDANMGVVGCGGAIGEAGKFDDIKDESELKYIKEANQSEKEQQATVGNGRNHKDDAIDDVDVDDDDDEDDYDNEGMPSMQYRNNGNDEHHNGAAKDDFDALYTDVGDFSQTSNTASTADGGCVDMLQVEMKIEPLQQQLQQQQQQHAFDEEDPSSNGTSSLSENAPMPQQLASTFDFLSDNADLLQQNKENTDPDKLSGASPVPRPTELNFEVHGSHLNPDAKEFVPSCGSNATSPTMSETADVEHVGEPVEQPLSALPRHRLLSGDDDVVARSPRKGREMNMDADNLVLPDSELDFDNEAQKRPHEFEQDEDLMGSNCVELAQSPTKLNDVEAEAEVEGEVEVEAKIEQKIELEPEANDVMKQSIYLAENGDIQQHEALENVLNSVQPLPTDIESLNSSFAEDVYAGTPEEMRAIDLLGHEIGVDEEHTSHPPSIEEMQMNLQNVKNKDEANMNLDMNSAAHMQESFYMEKHEHEQEQEQEQAINDNKELQQQQQEEEEPEQQQEEEQQHNDDGFYAQQFANNESLLMDTSIPAFSAEHNQSIDKQFINNDDFSGNAKVLDYDEQNIVTNMSSPSPKSTVEEKHLMEETKEQLVAKTIQDGQQFVEELGKKMENLLSTGIDCDLKQESATVTQIEEPTQFQNDAFEQQQFEEIVNEHENELLPKTEQQDPLEHVEAASEIAPTATIDVESAEIAAAAAVVATTAVAAAAVTAAQTDKKAEPATKKAAVKPAAAKSSTSTAAKKPITKTATSTTSAAARPRTAPAKVASSTASKTSVASSTAAKKPTSGTSAAASKTSLPAKPLASKPSTTSRVSLTAKSSTTTTTTTSAARKPLTTAASSTSTSTAGSAAKARPASAQPTKSTVSVTAAKPKISPRATLTSQLRNKVSPVAPAPTTSTTKATTVKSPTKPSAGSEATASKVASATRVKSATSTAAGTTSTTKLFTARPAPKTTTTSSVRSVTARTVSKTSPLKTSPRAVASTLKAKAATTKEGTKSPAKDTRKTPTKVGVKDASKAASKDAENKQKENEAQMNGGVEEKIGEENIQLQNGSVEVEKVTPLEIDGQV